MVLALISPLLLSVPANAQTTTITSGNDVDVLQAVFSTGSGLDIQNSSFPPGTQVAGSAQVDIVEVTVNDGGPVVLDNFNTGGVQATNFGFPAGLTGVRVWENGVATELADPNFQTALNGVLGSTDLRDYLAYDALNQNGDTFNPDFDLIFSAPLNPDDYLFVSERNGNTDFDLTPLDINGNPIPGAETLIFDAAYGWNTGYAPIEFSNQPTWFTIADVEDFFPSTTPVPVYGFRVNNDGQADVKFFGASADPFTIPSSIAGSVFDDLGNPLVGVTITLTGTDINGNPVSLTTTTNLNGDYIFPNLEPGDYTLTETQPAGYGDATDVVGDQGGTLGNDVISAITLGNGVDAVDYDFIETYGSIAGTVVVDADNDGVADSGETPIAGVTITLTGTDVNGNAVNLTATTDANGDYVFENLLAGDYTVTETQPAGFVDGLESAGSTGGTVSDDEIADITLPAGEDSVDNDFAELLEAASIAGSVLDDLGAPIAGVTITLTGTDVNGNAVTLTTTTDANGAYEFTDLVPGTYTVTETQPAGYGDTADVVGSNGGTLGNDVISDIVLEPGDAAVDYDFVETYASIAGTVVVDANNDGIADSGETPIAGVTITLTGTDANGNAVTLTTTTDANGDYQFDGLLAGDYTVTETQPAGFVDGLESAGSTGGTVSDDEIADITLPAGEDSVDNDFAELPLPASIAGSVIDDLGNPIPGVTITLTGTDVNGNAVTLTTTTDANGDYEFTDLIPGTYTVTETQPAGYGDTTDVVGSNGGTLGNDVISEIVLEAGDAAVDNDFIETSTFLSGTVFLDQNQDGVIDPSETDRVEGVAVELYDENGVFVAITTTDANGFYSFDGLAAGEYDVVQIQPAGYQTTTPNVILTVQVPEEGLPDVDFGEVLGSIEGSVVDETGAPIPGVTVTLNGTDVNGDPVVLVTTTDANGDYVFPDLLAGEYTVIESQPAGFDDGADTPGTTGGDPSVNDVISSIVLGAGESSLDNDFAEVVAAPEPDPDPEPDPEPEPEPDPDPEPEPEPDPEPEPGPDPELGSVEGQVFQDGDIDGQLDTTDGPVEGVTVNLKDLNCVIVDTTTTDENGIYRFENIPPGDYLLEIIPPPGTTLTSSNLGSDLTDSDFSATSRTVRITVTAGQVTTNIDAGITVARPVPPVTSNPPALAFTGANSIVLALLGIVLLGLGTLQMRFGIAAGVRRKDIE